MSVHEHKAQVNVVWASLPAHSWTGPAEICTGGPPPAHFAPGSPRTAVFAQCPSEHPSPGPHSVPHMPQWWLSIRTSMQLPAHAVSPGKQLVLHPPPEHT